MQQTPMDMEAMAEALSRSHNYRVLRRLVASPTYVPALGQEVRTGILLDTGVSDTFSAFNEPSTPISAEVTALTGITNEMVGGHKFDDVAVTAFVESAVITIAHNSGFDRKFAERYWPVFRA